MTQSTQTYFNRIAAVMLAGLAACSSPKPVARDVPLSLQWEIVDSPVAGSNETLSLLTLRNTSTDTLANSGWAIYFNAGVVGVADADTVVVGIEMINGDFFTLYPKSGWKALAPDSAVRLHLRSRRIKNFTDIPKGFYLVDERYPDGKSLSIEFKPFAKADSLERELAVRVFEQNEPIVDLPLSELPPVLPTPVTYQYRDITFTLDNRVTILADSLFQNEAEYLQDELAKVLGERPKMVANVDPAGIRIRYQNSLHSEGYTLSVDSNGVLIEAATPAGAFYGIQSLKLLLPPGAWKTPSSEIVLRGLTIKDNPRFAHRAVMLDVSRNFQSKDQVKKILDLLALYKINVMHFHLTEDEAWRLEIPGLPELTEIGGQRGHTLDDATHLVPSYGSGPSMKNPAGSGYYSRADFVDILRYAKARHIRVIPEIETPGHARAAIKSMDARYVRLLATGDTAAARQYLLRDPDDQSVYRSVQNWNDNVINVAMPSVYAFLEKVVDEIIAMYREADAPLATIHFGGDEVPNGVWENSPAAERLMAREHIAQTDELWYYYFTRINGLLKARGLYLSGWEEIGMKKAVVDGKKQMVVEPRFAAENFHADVWNNLGTNVDLAYRLANAGYKVVLTNVTNFYIDLAYSESFYEPGQYWGGYVDVDKLFRFVPFDYYRSLETKVSGVQLTEAGRANIVGLQAPLWSEIITSPERMEYLLLPKMFGLAERAWATDPVWATDPDDLAVQQAYWADWSTFVNILGKRELPRLDHYGGGYAYRIPTAGVVKKGNQLYANVQFPGFEIRYTTDGSEPTAKSPLYTDPIPATGLVAFRVFNASGRGGRTVYWD